MEEEWMKEWGKKKKGPGDTWELRGREGGCICSGIQGSGRSSGCSSSPAPLPLLHLCIPNSGSRWWLVLSILLLQGTISSIQRHLSLRNRKWRNTTGRPAGGGYSEIRIDDRYVCVCVCVNVINTYSSTQVTIHVIIYMCTVCTYIYI